MVRGRCSVGSSAVATENKRRANWFNTFRNELISGLDSLPLEPEFTPRVLTTTTTTTGHCSQRHVSHVLVTTGSDFIYVRRNCRLQSSGCKGLRYGMSSREMFGTNCFRARCMRSAWRDVYWIGSMIWSEGTRRTTILKLLAHNACNVNEFTLRVTWFWHDVERPVQEMSCFRLFSFK